MTWDWSFLRNSEFVFGVVAGLMVSVAANFMTKAIERWRDRRSARRHEEYTKRSARKQELFEYRRQLARQDKFKAMLMFHRGNALRVIAAVWKGLGSLMMLIGIVGYFAAATMLEGLVGWRDFVPLVASVLLGVGGAFFWRRGDTRFEVARDFLDPVEDTLSDADKPLLYPDAWLDIIDFKTSTQSEASSAPVKK
jgi:hypothetical protein